MNEPAPAIAQTHISTVFFTADRAYKLLRPVRTSFLDFGDPAARVAAAQREYELNRRFAPDVYLGTADVVEQQQVVDRMIVMRRLPDDRRLSVLAQRPGFERVVGDVARAVASMHAGLEPSADTSMATRDAVASRWDENFRDLERVAGGVIDDREQEAVHSLSTTFLGHRAALFDQRIEQGWIRDGHGDLTAEDVFVLDDGARFIDCLAFRDDFRIGDVLADVGFLAMDLHRLAGPDAARLLMARYHEFSYEHHPSSLAHHYVAYRAHVRAKIAAARALSGEAGHADLARTYHRLSHHHLVRGQVTLVLVGGGPGSGKSTLSEGISASLGWMALHIDEIRKDLAGVGHHVHLDAGEAYSPERKDAAYRALLAQAASLLDAGESVVLDASWTDAGHRELAARLAAERGARLVEVRCQVDRDEARRRVAQRRATTDDASDATEAIVDLLERAAAPWPSATAVDTSCPPSDAVATAVEAVRPR